MDKLTDAVTSLRPYWGTENSEDETYLEEASHWDKVLEDSIFLLGFLCLSLSASWLPRGNGCPFLQRFIRPWGSPPFRLNAIETVTLD